MTTPNTTESPAPDDSAASTPRPVRDTIAQFAHPIVTAVLALTAAALVLGRFFVDTPMWLDEALSVNIAKLPLGDIADALRHDGHPPLYYVLLHGWMSVFGDSDAAVRSLSTVISIATLPLAYLAGRRLGGRRVGVTAMLLLALSPYAFRYGSEARMYSLLTLIAFAGFIAVSAALETPRPLRLVAVAVATAAGLWTQYWSLWLIATAGLLVVWVAVRSHRNGNPSNARGAWMTAVAMCVGGLAFVPWLPTMLYQSAHTGTPWAPSFRITNLVVTSLVEFTGGAYSEAQLGSFVLVCILLIAITGRSVSANAIELRTAINSDALVPLVLLCGTVVIASAVALVNGMAFAPRYASVYFPFVILLAALGINRFANGRARDAVLIAVALLSVAGVFLSNRQDRSQVGVAADAIRSRSDRGVVVVCPDQLGPSMSRQLDENQFDVVRYPDFGDPHFVDWVDYAERNANNDPAAFGAAVLELAQGRPLFAVFGDGFLTLEGQCGAVVETLASQRAPERLISPKMEDFYEPVTVMAFAG